MIIRTDELDKIGRLLSVFPVTAILGARQVGKSTLARQISSDHYFDLENPLDFIKFNNPQFLLDPLTGLIVIDEIQLKPDLFPLLRYLSDTRHDQKYLILGSASPDLIKGSSETLAGRVGYLFLGGFSLEEAGFDYRHLWLTGGFPKSFLLKASDSRLWRENFIRTFLERDIPRLGISIPSNTLRRFWTMLAHYHGQVLNYAELSRSFGVSDMTIRRYLEILEGTFMVRLLWPWHTNLGKRLVKSPKLYFTDSGILHSLLTIQTEDQLLSHSKLGASWEGFCLNHAIRILGRKDIPVYFHATHSGSEIDLFWQSGGQNYGLEIKFSERPRISRSLTIVMGDLNLSKVWIVYPGKDKIQLHENVHAIPVTALASVLES